jgi:hypothetical protein
MVMKRVDPDKCFPLRAGPAHLHEFVTRAVEEELVTVVKRERVDVKRVKRGG